MFTRPDNWSKLSPLERRKVRLDAWQNAPVEFVSPEAEANYKERIERLRKIYDMEPHDRPIADLFMGVMNMWCAAKGLPAKTWFTTMRNCENLSWNSTTNSNQM